MQGINAVVARELIGLTIQCELALANAVADTTNSSTYIVISTRLRVEKKSSIPIGCKKIKISEANGGATFIHLIGLYAALALVELIKIILQLVMPRFDFFVTICDPKWIYLWDKRLIMRHKITII